jgi:2-methylcitrate dehydratase PrpD
MIKGQGAPAVVTHKENAMMGSKRIADFIIALDGSKLPEAALERAKTAIMDYVGVTFAGLSERCSEIVREVVETLGGHPQATVWGTKIKTSILLAALANGTAAHALDYDDVNSIMRSHPSIQLLPALFAVGEYEHRNGREILTAYVTGFEVGAKLGRALNPELVFQGWFPVGTLGTLMQAVACAKLLKLNADQVRMAIGIATNLASGLRCNNGTMAKPLMAGQVGSNGALAALLAKRGMTANERALEAPFGFFENFSRGDRRNLDQAIRSLGEPLEIVQLGITTKLYPCCAGSHMAIDCALHLARQHKINPDEIHEVRVSISKNAQYLLIHPRPRTEMEAKFSLEYAVARGILDGQVGPQQFTPDKIKEPRLEGLIEKIKPNYYDALDSESKGEWTRLPVKIDISTKNGKTFSFEVDRPKGSPRNPLTPAEFEEKFRRCVRGKFSESTTNRVLDQLKNFEKLPDVASLMALWGQTQKDLS